MENFRGEEEAVQRFHKGRGVVPFQRSAVQVVSGQFAGRTPCGLQIAFDMSSVVFHGIFQEFPGTVQILPGTDHHPEAVIGENVYGTVPVMGFIMPVTAEEILVYQINGTIGSVFRCSVSILHSG